MKQFMKTSKLKRMTRRFLPEATAKRSWWRRPVRWERIRWPPWCVAESSDPDSRPGARSAPDCRPRRCSWCTDRANSGSGSPGCLAPTSGPSFRCKLKKINLKLDNAILIECGWETNYLSVNSKIYWAEIFQLCNQSSLNKNKNGIKRVHYSKTCYENFILLSISYMFYYVLEFYFFWWMITFDELVSINLTR